MKKNNAELEAKWNAETFLEKLIKAREEQNRGYEMYGVRREKFISKMQVWGVFKNLELFIPLDSTDPMSRATSVSLSMQLHFKQAAKGYYRMKTLWDGSEELIETITEKHT